MQRIANQADGGIASLPGPPARAGRLHAEVAAGLTSEQVAERIVRGEVNDVPSRTSRTLGDIVRANVFTRINAILGVLLIIALAAGSPIDAMFGLVIIANSAIGVIQEVRAKLTLDRLAILNISRPTVRRDGVAVPLDPQLVVIDDIVEVGPGDQIIVDGELVEGAALEIDESLVSGEADPVVKPVGASLLSGSIVVAGTGAYRATAVGHASYSARLAEEAKKFALTRFELRAGIDRILGVVTLLIVPAGMLIVYSQLFTSGQPLAPALVGLVAALAPMVPEGLVLMTSIAFALGVIRLGRIDCLVQDLAAIEALARVDVVCIDKTGTLTEQGMTLVDLLPCDGGDTAIAQSALASLAHADGRPNATMEAIRAGLGVGPLPGQPISFVPFSSARKWQGVTFADHGSWILGAPDVLLPPDSDIAKRAELIGAKGLRVLLLGRVDQLPATAGMPVVEPELLIVLGQRLRADASTTLAYFASQGVAVKVVSGDNVASVQAVARALRLDGSEAARDARDLPSDPLELAELVEATSIFGRVQPDQKRQMVAALRSSGHTVAMMGDGVNDVLALKLADVGVAMGSGSAASRAVAQIVLLGNNFNVLPAAVGEGRRVIGNVERISNLFLSKTVYSALLALIIGAIGVAATFLEFDPVPFPFLPRHIMISAWFTIGIPAFILSLAPTNERVRSGFVSRVLRLAIPSGMVVTLMTLGVYLTLSVGGFTAATNAQASTSALLTLIIVMLHVLSIVCRPYENWKLLLLAACVLGYVGLFGLPWTRNLLALDVTNWSATGFGVAMGLIGAILVEAISHRLRRSTEPAR